MDVVSGWIRRHLANPQVVSLAVVLLLALLSISWFGATLGPVFAAIVIAFLLEGPVARLEQWHCPRHVATFIVWLSFVAAFFVVLFALVPLMTRQAGQVIQEVPQLIVTAREYLQTLPERYPQLFSPSQVDDVVMALSGGVGEFRNAIFARSWVVGMGLLYASVYLVLVPLLVFFFLKDKRVILGWARSFLPQNITLIDRIWRDVDRQLANYVRGKFVEIMIVGGVSFVVFYWFGLNYSALLATLVGVSVLIPYLGALAATVPVAIVAYAQWGFSADFAWILLAYGIIQALDGNVLVPLLFSEAVNLHPVAIIVAVLFFGGVWGFWGVFFAIPLATVVNAILVSWPAPELGLEEEFTVEPIDGDDAVEGVADETWPA